MGLLLSWVVWDNTASSFCERKQLAVLAFSKGKRRLAQVQIDSHVSGKLSSSFSRCKNTVLLADPDLDPSLILPVSVNRDVARRNNYHSTPTLILTPSDCKQLLKAMTQVRMAEPGCGPEKQSSLQLRIHRKVLHSHSN